MKKEKCFATLVLCWCLWSSLWIEVYAESRSSKPINHEPYPKRSKSSSDSEQSNFGSNETEQNNFELSSKKEDKNGGVTKRIFEIFNDEHESSEPRADSTEVSPASTENNGNIFTNIINKISATSGAIINRLSKTTVKSFFGGIEVLKNSLIKGIGKFFKNCFWYEIGFVDNCVWYWAYKGIQLPIKYALQAVWKTARGVIETAVLTALPLLPVVGPFLLPVLPAYQVFKIGFGWAKAWAPMAYNIFTGTYTIVRDNADRVLQIGLPIVKMLMKLLQGLGKKS